MSHSPRPIVEADIHAFVDGQMEFDRRAVLVQAMASDPDLRDRIDQWRRQNEALTATFGGVLREPVPLRLMPTNLVRERVVAREIAPTPIDRSRSHSSGRVLAVAVAAFLAGGGAMFSVGAMTSGPPSVTGARDPDIGVQSGARGLALRAYEAHRTFATDFAHPVEVSADDGPHLLKWLQHRLSLAIRLPDLRRQGWTLVGGRVLPGELAPAAFLIYANGVERVGLYIARTNARHADEVALYDNGAGLGSVGYWVDEPIGYALTTNRDSAWLDRDGADLIEAIKTQLRDNASAY